MQLLQYSLSIGKAVILKVNGLNCGLLSKITILFNINHNKSSKQSHK